MFLLGLTMTTNGGMYILTIMNNHSGEYGGSNHQKGLKIKKKLI